MGRSENKLTSTAVKNATNGDLKQRKLSDGGGLTLLVRPESKVWWFRYRFAGKEQTLTLGNYPQVSLKEARAKRDEARRLLVDGTDPSAHRRSLQEVKSQELDTFKKLAHDWLELQKGELAPGTITTTLTRMEKWIFPHIGAKPVNEIEAPQVLAALRRIEAKGLNETAHRMRQRISQMYRFAIGEGRAIRDPAADLKGLLKTVPTKNRAALTKPAEVGALLRAIDGYNGFPTTCAALQLAPLLFVRPGELRKAEWHEINLEARTWTIPGDRMKGSMRAKRAGQITDHIVHLSRQALAILEPLKEITGNRLYVFESVRRGRPLSENAVRTALMAMGYDGGTMTGHGFRATASTLLHEIGYPPEVIELQLAHQQRNQVAAAYNRSARLKERAAMLQAWADYLDGLKAGATVIPLHQTVKA